MSTNLTSDQDFGFHAVFILVMVGMKDTFSYVFLDGEHDAVVRFLIHRVLREIRAPEIYPILAIFTRNKKSQNFTFQ